MTKRQWLKRLSVLILLSPLILVALISAWLEWILDGAAVAVNCVGGKAIGICESVAAKLLGADWRQPGVKRVVVRIGSTDTMAGDL